MRITKGATAMLITDIVTFTDEVNAQGQRCPISSFKRDHLRRVNSIKEKLSSIKEHGVGRIEEFQKKIADGSFDQEDLTWVPHENLDLKAGERIYGLRFLDEEVEFTLDEIKVIGFFDSQRKELPPETPTEALDELDALLKHVDEKMKK